MAVHQPRATSLACPLKPWNAFYLRPGSIREREAEWDAQPTAYWSAVFDAGLEFPGGYHCDGGLAECIVRGLFDAEILNRTIDIDHK